MFTVGSDYKIKLWNSAAENIFGKTSGQVVAKKCYEVLCAGGKTGRVECARGCSVISNAAKGRTTKDFDLDCKTTNGDIKTINMSIVIPSANDGPREIIHVFRDVTDRRRIEQITGNPSAYTSMKSDTTAHSLGRSSYRLPHLTTREDQVLKLLAVGKNTNDIAEILDIRPLTARNHIGRLMTKLGCRSRLEAVALGTRAGLI
jgi:PAS domain S-box-containing protein